MRFTLCNFVGCILWGTTLSFLAWGQDQATRPSASSLTQDVGEFATELAAIRAQSEMFVAAFNRRDAKAVAELWTEDGEYLDSADRRFDGREAIEREYAQFFADHSEAKIQITIESLRLLSPNAAIEDGIAVVDLAPDGDSNSSSYTAVHVKRDGKWLMASVREPLEEVSEAAQNAADLDWLVGAWIAEDHGVKIESDCRWVADGRFLERRYTTTQIDGSQTSGVQIIGWNPLEEHVQSWDFSPDGGHSVGTWSPIEGGWQAEMRGTTGDGSPTAAVNSLRRLDDNAYVWQSVRRFLGDVGLPDTDEVIIKRDLKSNVNDSTPPQTQADATKSVEN